MTNGEVVSRVSNQLRMMTKDDYISNRFVLNVAKTIAKKFITQKIQRRTLARDSSLYKEVGCIEFEEEDVFSCPYIEFKSCQKLSKSKMKFNDLVFTRYGSSIKELYTIDRQKSFIESTLYQLRNDSEREGGKDLSNRYYLLNDHIYVPDTIEVLSGLVLGLDHYDLDENCGCNEDCMSAWDHQFVAPDSMLEDILSHTIQNITITKQIPEDSKPNLNPNDK